MKLNIIVSLFLINISLSFASIENIMDASASPKDCYDILTTLQKTQTHKIAFLPVPENYYTDNIKEPMNILVYFPHKITEKTTIFINGGPSASSHSSYHAFMKKDPEIAKNIIFFDQRGTGCSTAYPKYDSYKKMSALQNWGARSIAIDIEMIKNSMIGQEKKVNILGQSYGGLVALKYASLFPESIRSLNVHGFSYMSDYSDFNNLRRYNEKIALDKFFKEYPEAKESMNYLINITPANLCMIDISRLKLCGKQIWDPIAKNIGFSSTWKNTAFNITSIHEALDLDYTQNTLDWYFNVYIKPEFENSQVRILSLLDEMNFDPKENNLKTKNSEHGQELNNKTIQQIISAMDFMGESSGEDFSTWLEKRGEDVNEVLISYSRFEEKLIVRDYTLSPSELLEKNNVSMDLLNFDKVENNIKKYGFKVNIYSGKADTYAPPIIFEEMVERLKGYSTYTILESGHGGFLEDDIVWDSI